ncbi:Histidine kinase [Chitinophaga sp. CF118]|nr:Histidine kinase [Chitinophaga sp. CF118]
MVSICFANLSLLRMMSEKKTPESKKNKIQHYLLSYFSTIIVWFVTTTLFLYITTSKWHFGETRENVSMAYTLAVLTLSIMNTLILFLQNFIILQHNKAKAEIENLQLQANVSETANLLLRQQIHPHFLFNSLTTIKSLYKKDLQEGENYLMHLANFLRAVISNNSNKTTLIKDELMLCMDYLEMQKMRFGPALNYTIDISEETSQEKCLPYFSLQPLLENALKHNDLTEDRPLFLSVKEEGEYLVVTNNIQQRRSVEASTGVGLANLSERYHILAGEEIIIKSDTYFFQVYIKTLNK